MISLPMQKTLESKIIGPGGEEIEIVEPKESEIILKGTDAEWIRGILLVKAQVEDPVGRVIKGKQALHNLNWVSFPYEWFILPLNEILPP